MDTNARLHALFMQGASYAEMMAELGMTLHALDSRISRLRTKEGEDRWPRRKSPCIHPKATQPPPPKSIPRGQPTLPPLPSLATPTPTPPID